jgi:hypothetical protein
MLDELLYSISVYFLLAVAVVGCTKIEHKLFDTEEGKVAVAKMPVKHLRITVETLTEQDAVMFAANIVVDRHGNTWIYNSAAVAIYGDYKEKDTVIVRKDNDKNVTIFISDDAKWDTESTYAEYFNDKHFRPVSQILYKSDYHKIKIKGILPVR